jgi:hypothetical protein
MAARQAADEKRIKLEAEETTKKQKEAARVAAEAERKSVKALEQEAAEVKMRAHKAEAGQLATGQSNREVLEAVKEIIEPVAVPDHPPTKPGKKGTAVSRNGMIKLTVSHDTADAAHVSNFESSLREIPGLKIIMVSGDTKEGIQILVSSENPVVLSEKLRELPLVKEVEDRHSDILVILQPLVVLKVNL